jgi:hypothetical protein
VLFFVLLHDIQCLKKTSEEMLTLNWLVSGQSDKSLGCTSLPGNNKRCMSTKASGSLHQSADVSVWLINRTSVSRHITVGLGCDIPDASSLCTAVSIHRNTNTVVQLLVPESWEVNERLMKYRFRNLSNILTLEVVR